MNSSCEPFRGNASKSFLPDRAISFLSFRQDQALSASGERRHWGRRQNPKAFPSSRQASITATRTGTFWTLDVASRRTSMPSKFTPAFVSVLIVKPFASEAVTRTLVVPFAGGYVTGCTFGTPENGVA